MNPLIIDLENEDNGHPGMAHENAPIMVIEGAQVQIQDAVQGIQEFLNIPPPQQQAAVPLPPDYPVKPARGLMPFRTPPEARDGPSQSLLVKALRGTLPAAVRGGVICFQVAYYGAPDGLRWRCVACHTLLGGDPAYTFVSIHVVARNDAIEPTHCPICQDEIGRREELRGCGSCSLTLIAHRAQIKQHRQIVESTLNY